MSPSINTPTSALEQTQKELRWRRLLARENPGVLERVLKELKRRGLLLHADARLSSVASLAAGEPVKGPWWGHPKGRLIWAVGEELAAREDVLLVKLLYGKQTWIHKKLRLAFLSVALSDADWQRRGLTPVARALLKKVEREGRLRADSVAVNGKTVTELERRLLVHAEEVHTETGAHARVLESWPYWMKRRKLRAALPGPEAARAALEKSALALGVPAGDRKALPWR